MNFEKKNCILPLDRFTNVNYVGNNANERRDNAMNKEGMIMSTIVAIAFKSDAKDWQESENTMLCRVRIPERYEDLFGSLLDHVAEEIGISRAEVETEVFSKMMVQGIVATTGSVAEFLEKVQGGLDGTEMH